MRNVGYVITCIDCQNRGLDRRYEGETGGEARRRAVQHQQDLRAKKMTSGLYRHAVEEHGGVVPEFRFQVRQRFEDAMTRQIEESSRIEGEEEEKLLNTRQEWQPPLLSRVVVDCHHQKSPNSSTSTYFVIKIYQSVHIVHINIQYLLRTTGLSKPVQVKK